MEQIANNRDNSVFYTLREQKSTPIGGKWGVILVIINQFMVNRRFCRMCGCIRNDYQAFGLIGAIDREVYCQNGKGVLLFTTESGQLSPLFCPFPTTTSKKTKGLNTCY